MLRAAHHMVGRTTDTLTAATPPGIGPRLLWLSLLAAACSGASLLGWMFSAPRLAGFGYAHYPNWPLAGLAFILLPLAFLAQAGRAPKSSLLLLLALPIAIGGGALIEYAGLRIAGFDIVLFARSTLAYPLPTPGRPGIIPTVSILLASSSILLMARRGRLTGQALMLVNALLIGLNLMSATLLLLGADVLRQHVRVASSLPACFPPILMALASFEWMAERSSSRVMAQASNAWGGGRFMLPLLIGLPAVLLPIIDQAGAAGILPRLFVEVLASSTYLLLISVLLLWSLTRITREHQTLNVLTHALDTVPILMTDDQDRITHWSAGCARLFGWSEAEAIGQRLDLRLRLGPLDRDALRPPPVGGTTLRDLVTTRADGSTLALRAQSTRVGVEGEEGTRIAIALTDTSSLRRAQADLEGSEEKLQIAIESHQIGIFDSDPVNDRLVWTLHASIHHGLPPGRPLRRADWEAVIEPADLIAFARRRDEAIAALVPQFSFRYRTRPAEGDPRVIEGSVRCFYDEQGEPVRLLGVTVDVTDREERAAALERREAQLRSIVMTVPDAMLITARDGTVRQAGAAAERMFGYPANEIVDRPLASLILNRVPSESWAESAMHPDAALKTGTARTLIGRRAGGEEFPIELIVAKTAHEDSEFVAFVRDLSARHAEQARIEELSAEYAHFARLTAVGAMASTLAHEINQPLAACSNFLATARILTQRGESGDRVATLLKQAGDQILRAGEIIRRTREFVGKNDGDLSVEELGPLIQEAVALGMTGRTGSGIRMRYHFDANAAAALVDRIQIQQVIVNLVRNAAEALGPRRFGLSEIHITTTALDDETIAVSVRDTGPGIPEPLLETIGSAFHSTKSDGSMGLGLSICRRIVEAHGGELAASNHPDGGAIFSFTIPGWIEPTMAEARG